MKTEAKYKFAPIWVAGLSLFELFILYKFCVFATNAISFDFSVLFLAIVTGFISWLILPMTIKMLRGIPAILLTKDYLVDNFGGHSIEWNDIAEISIRKSSYQGLDKLIINLKQPEKYFNTSIKKLLYKFSRLFVANDIGITLDFVSGNSDEIMQVMHAHWDKHSGL